MLLRIFSVRICRFGISVGPLSWMERIFEVVYSKLMYFYSVRESHSLGFVRSLGIKKAQYFCDLIFLDNEIKEIQTITNRRLCVLSFRDNIYSFTNKTRYDRQNILTILNKLIFGLCELNSFDFVASYQVKEDFLLSRWIALNLKERGINLKNEMLDWNSAVGLYSASQVVISNRLHVLLLGMKNGALPFAVIDAKKHFKIASIFHDAGLDNLVFDVSTEINFVRLSQIWEEKDVFLMRIKNLFENEQKHALQILSNIF